MGQARHVSAPTMYAVRAAKQPGHFSVEINSLEPNTFDPQTKAPRL